MSEYLENEANRTRTENGAEAFASTGSACLDLFATVGALRHQSENDILTRFIRAYTEDPDSALKLLFFARDVRGGLGERRVFRVILRYLASVKPESVRKNVGFVAEYGRWDDLLSLFGTPCEKDALAVLREQFEKDRAALEAGEAVSLLGKWLPSPNTSSLETRKNAKRVMRAFNLTEEAYRRTLTALRKAISILENNLREKDYTFDYAKQPSRALFKYKKAFIRRDGERYRAFLSAAEKGQTVLHADNVSPYELIEPYLRVDRWYDTELKSVSPEEEAALNATWAALPDFSSDENILPVIDTSGSMYCCASPMPAAVALSLGLYCAEHNRGAFRNCFIEFSRRPQLIKLKGKTFFDKLRYVVSFNEVANTNLEAVFDLILNAAVRCSVPQEDLPAKLVLISDMEFDCCVDHANKTVYRRAAEKFAAHGYRLPQVVFWNVASRHRQQPVTQNEQGVALVSGVTPRLFAMIAGGVLSPAVFMAEVLSAERYAKIAA